MNTIQRKERVFFRKSKTVGLVLLDRELDLEPLTKWRNDARILARLGATDPMHYADEKGWLEKVTQDTGGSRHTFGVYYVDDNVLIGTMGIHDIDYVNGTSVTGALIGETTYQGKGLGVQAKMLLLDFAFNTLGLRKVYSKVHEHNANSVRYSNKCGYVIEATLPEHIYFQGKYWSEITMAVYRNTWLPLWEAWVVENLEADYQWENQINIYSRDSE